jgi:hypothetical protein
MTDITPAYVKGLFHSLVKAVGGVEAAGLYLGISHQRISVLQNPQSADMPTIMHVVTLEAVVGQDLVTGVLARNVNGEAARHDLMTEACEAVEAGANVLHLARRGGDRLALHAAARNLHKQSSDVLDAVARDHARTSAD